MSKELAKPETEEYSKELDQWYETEGYKNFCKWWSFRKMSYIGTYFCADFAAGDSWRYKDQEVAHLKARLEAAETLIEHARHDEGCSASIDERYTCKCGYNKAREAYDELKQKDKI